MFDKLTTEELSALLSLLMDAETRFGAVYGPYSYQADDMYQIAFDMPTFDYVDVDQEFIPGRP